MSLTCQKETSGWGADDIALQIRADGELIADIPNSVIGDFEDDSVRHVGDKVRRRSRRTPRASRSR